MLHLDKVFKQLLTFYRGFSNLSIYVTSNGKGKLTKAIALQAWTGP